MKLPFLIKCMLKGLQSFLGEKRPTITPSRPAPSPPKKANENVQQMTKTTEVEVDNDGPIEVENKVFMFDTESEDDEEEEVTTTVKVEVPVNAAKKQTQRDPKVDEIEASFKDISECITISHWSMHLRVLR